MKPVLQLALDFLDIKRAIAVAKESIAGGTDWIEAGTPLIKSEGLNSVRTMRKLFPKNKIVADMKSMDAGRYEVESAAKAGADIVIILGVADNSTIKEAVEAGKNYGCEIMVDLMNVEDMSERARTVEEIGADYVCVHLGIDQQMRGTDPIAELKNISNVVKIPLAIAGGINSETAADAVNAGASIVIVGGAITKAEDAKKSTEIIKRSIAGKKAIKTRLYKKYKDPEEIFRIVSSANISDAMHRGGCMEGIRSVSGMKVVGRAITVRTYPGDWAKPVEAIDIAEKGSIIVIDAGGIGNAVWGELASISSRQKGVAGVVIDGAIRDTEEIKGLKFPAFSRRIKSSAGEPKGFGEINVPIKCGGILVKPGDWIIGDSDGVVVVPKENAVEISNRALDIYEKENRVREEIRRRSTLSQVMEIKKWERVR